MRIKECTIIYDVDKMPVDVKSTIKNNVKVKEWAYIVHDKDDIHPHYHIYLKLIIPCNISTIASWFGIADIFVQKFYGEKVDILPFLTHSRGSLIYRSSLIYRHKYSSKDVISNFNLK